MLYYGVVEDRLDPLKAGRVRVRVFDVHTHRKDQIATPDLPWSMVMMPSTVAGLGGFGQNHSLIEGTHVVGMFTDEELQQFVVLGVHQGYSSQGVLITEGNDSGENRKFLVVNEENQNEIGFSDPRVRADGISSYTGRPDGKNPKHFPQRSYGLEKKLDFYPALPDSINPQYDQTTNKPKNLVKEELEFSKKIPYYPLKKTVSDKITLDDGSKIDEYGFDINKYSGIDNKQTTYFSYRYGLLKRDLGDNLEDFPVRTKQTPVYPFNKVTYTESGHLFELDDTPHRERVSLQHRSGTYFEWQPDGDADTRVMKNNYTAICGNDTIYVGGKVKIKVLGDATLDVGGDLKADVAGKTTIDGTDDITVTAPVISMNGTTIKLNS